LYWKLGDLTVPLAGQSHLADSPFNNKEMKESYALLTGQSCSQIDFKYTFLIFIVLVGKKKFVGRLWPLFCYLAHYRILRDVMISQQNGRRMPLPYQLSYPPPH
jgi:hypothetical protein